MPVANIFRRLAGVLLLSMNLQAQAQMPIRPPPFMGGIPGLAQWQAIETQRHHARTLLYREALEELRQNPRAADLNNCAGSPGGPCIPPPAPDAAAPSSPETPPRKLALLVGNNAYPSPIPSLETPVHDVRQVAQVLREQFGYKVSILNNADKASIAKALGLLAGEAGPGDSVLIMYAGHGYLMDETGMGYWLPVDASVKTAANWISNTDISRFLQAIPSRQVILVSDSCFSGTLAREQQIDGGAPLSRDEILRRRTVLVLSSGGEEPVTDEGREGNSIFAWSLIRSLNSLQGGGRGFEIYQQVRNQVSRVFPQEPQYGAVISAGHVKGGDYLLEKKTD